MESSSKESKSTLSTGKYTIELSNGPSAVYKIDNEGNKIWVCSASDPQVAMDLIEGLILVEHKRFYYPDSTPSIGMSGTTPPFLKKN
jgi:hypothetical protein